MPAAAHPSLPLPARRQTSPPSVQERQLAAAEAEAMGQLLLNCCEDEDETTCLGLKEGWPMTLLDSDNSTNPNYCYIRPNICTL